MRLGLGLGVSGQHARGGFSGGHAFNPKLLPGLVLWIRSDIGITLNGNNVSAWADLSGAGHHLTQATATKQPPYSATGGPNNLPFVGTFDRVDDWLRATWPQAQPVHTFAVALHSMSDATTGVLLDGSVFNTLSIKLNAAADDPRVTLGSTELGAGGVTAESTAWHRYEIQSVNPCFFFVDGVEHATGFSGTHGGDGVTLGIGGNTATDPTDCRWAELIMYNRILSASDAAQVQAYLKARYSI